MLGFPLPFYKSDTLRLSLGLSWDVFTRVRAAASRAPSQVSRSHTPLLPAAAAARVAPRRPARRLPGACLSLTARRTRLTRARA